MFTWLINDVHISDLCWPQYQIPIQGFWTRAKILTSTSFAFYVYNVKLFRENIDLSSGAAAAADESTPYSTSHNLFIHI